MYRKLYVFMAIILVLTLFTQCSKMNKVELIYDAQAGVGEGALWDYENSRLLWIDITGKALYIYNPQSKTMNSYAMPKEIGTVVPIDSDNVLLALADGMYEFHISTKKLVQKSRPDIDTSLVRFNDGKCSPDGKLWVGTMDHGVSKPIAALYRVSGDYSVRKMVDGVTVSNGITWSPDGKTMYYIDSPTNTVVAYDYDINRSEISNKRIIIHTPKEWGTPDGNTIDSEGMLWVAHWGGGLVSRWNTTTGELLDTIRVPSPNVTSVALGGRNMKTLFITTARNWMKPGDEQKYPHAGGLFAVEVTVPGIKSHYFKIK